MALDPGAIVTSGFGGSRLPADCVLRLHTRGWLWGLTGSVPYTQPSYTCTAQTETGANKPLTPIVRQKDVATDLAIQESFKNNA